MGYPGGKAAAGVYQKIINLMPPHSLYVEPFLGGGAILRRKLPAARSLGLDLDPEVIAAWPPLPQVSVQVGDALEFLRWFRPAADALIYCDPPYLLDTRRSGPQYRCEMSEDHHRQLLALLMGLRCQVMLSGYWSPLYAEALRDWYAVHFAVRTRGGSQATEWLWCNFPLPRSLHDYRYLGRNFRERERIKRKTQRWKARLLQLPELERRAVLAALEELEPAPRVGSDEGGSAP